MDTVTESAGTHIGPPPTLTESRALALLGSGIPASTVAASLGLTHGAISHLLSDEKFAAKVAELRYENLAKYNKIDSEYDGLEATLIERLKDCLPLMHRPMEILKAIQTINSAKRRGVSTPEAIVEKQAVIQLVVPIQILNKFQTNVNGQVTTVGDQNLLTIQSGALDGLVKEKSAEKSKRLGVSDDSPALEIGVSDI